MKNILIIDDNPDDLEFYTDLIRQADENYRVYKASDFIEGMDIFERYRIDCTFLDYNLPEMNGLMILEVMNRRSNGEIPPVVILTGESNHAIEHEAVKHGAMDFLIKNITHNTPDQINTIIRKVTKWNDSPNTPH